MRVLTQEQLERKRAYNREYAKKKWASLSKEEKKKLWLARTRIEYRENNREKSIAYLRNYNLTHRKQQLDRQRKWMDKNREHAKTKMREWYQRTIETRHVYDSERRKKLKKQVVAAYGGKCSCCGEIRFEFLTVDHIGGRKKHGHSKKMSGQKLYAWLRRQGYPKEGFRILCANCNCSVGFYGYCPHDRERSAEVAAD